MAMAAGLGAIPGLGPNRRSCADGPWPARQTSQAVVLDDSSRHAATADRCTSGYDELAGIGLARPGALAAPASKSPGARAAGVGYDS